MGRVTLNYVVSIDWAVKFQHSLLRDVKRVSMIIISLKAKSRVQGSISRQLEALRNREVWLLNQLDTLSGAKEEILQQQSARLNKTLGILQSSVNFPQDTEASLTSKLERFV